MKGRVGRPIRIWVLGLAAAWAMAVLAASAQQTYPTTADAYQWNLPAGFPVPKVPADNPMTTAKVDLGRLLFFDTRLSGNLSMSCSSCHDPARAFTDGRAHPVGITGDSHPRHAMSLVNVAYSPTYTWANPNLTRLEDQALGPMFGEHPIELGLSGLERKLVERLQQVPEYPPLFARAFPGEPSPITVKHITYALAAFERTIISGQSPYDRFRTVDDTRAMSPEALRGQNLFFSTRLGCMRCHAGSNLTRSVLYGVKVDRDPEFFNIGLYNLDGTGRYPSPNEGLISYTTRPEDMGRFKPPTLRNIALTAPYMHDGSVGSLDEVLDIYAAGGRKVESGPYAGDGTKNPLKSPFITGFTLTPDEKRDVIAFLNALTDPALLSLSQFKNPWKR